MASDVIRAEAPVEAYDNLFEEGAQYIRPYRKTWYYPMFREALRQTKAMGARSVLEVGCGGGSFAQMLRDTTDLTYRGFDFSQNAVQLARRRNGSDELFSTSNALDAKSYAGTFDTIVCTEVLEHIERDLDVIRNWPAGISCVCSVPNFDDPTHVRLFRDEQQVRARYGDLIDIRQITRVARPLFRGRTFAEYLRRLRWSRNNRARFLAHLGIGTFDNLGGWFVFSGSVR